MVLSVNAVEFTAMRREVLRALAALSDGDYQMLAWVSGQHRGIGAHDDLTQNVHILYDDCQVLPMPESRLGPILLPGDEVDRLRALDRILGRLIDDLGDAPDTAYLADPRWAEVISAAGRALASMVL